MILRTPEYCSRFKCTADKCTDNCCIGWEIDIDDDTLKYYDSVDGEFGKKLSDNIAKGTPASFKLLENDRCPFLDERNLCEIYTKLGEEHLCQICTDHPRYFSWFKGVKEGGIGLGCEESARIILSQNTKFSTLEKNITEEYCAEDYSDELYALLYEAREKIFVHLQNRDIPIENRITDVLFYAEVLQQYADNGIYEPRSIHRVPELILPDEEKLIIFFSELEPLDLKWPEHLKSCMPLVKKASAVKDQLVSELPDFDVYLENLAVYFIWRYFMKGVFSEEFYSYAFLMTAGVVFIRFLCECHYIQNGSISEKYVLNIAKNFSKEVEYSEDNLNTVLDLAYSYCDWDSECCDKSGSGIRQGL